MVVWDQHGHPSRVVSVREDGTVEVESKTTVRLWYAEIQDTSPAQFDITLEWFLLNYHRRLTAWERLDRVKFYEPKYDGPLRGYFVIETSPYGPGHHSITKIERRARTLPIEVQKQRDEILAIAGYGGHSERFEKFEALGWKLVLDPAL